MKNILDVTKSLQIPDEFIMPYGWDKAKIRADYYDQIKDSKTGKLVLVTALTPTKAGEGKTTVTIGLHDGLRRIGVKSLACLREPSLGPVWGVKGGAVGALKSTVVPSDDINLHFTGDMHALTSTINLISAIIENHIWQGNELNIDPDRVVWTRAEDINDRSLRNIRIVYDDNKMKAIHNSEFTITVASELMTILCLSKDKYDFINRVNNIIVAYDYEGNPVTFGQFNCSKAIYKMMKDALNPNLVQTLEENPVLIHGGPFANISIGVNSLTATRMALKMSDVVVTEAGFGADLGAEKFMDIACQEGNFHPDCVVLVASIRALKLHGGVKFEDLDKENKYAVRDGFDNLLRHYENMKKFLVPVVVAVNRFPSDTDAEIEMLNACLHLCNIKYEISTAALEGSAGSEKLAQLVKKTLEEQSSAYEPIIYTADETSLEYRIEKICTQIYRANGVELSDEAKKKLDLYEKLGYRGAYVCISKTPNSFTDDPKVLGAPEGFTIHIRDVKLYAGANLVVPLSGSLMLMPGLPKEPRCLDKFNEG